MTPAQLKKLTVADLLCIVKEYGEVLRGMLGAAYAIPAPITNGTTGSQVHITQPGMELTPDMKEHLDSQRSIRAARAAQDRLKAGSQSAPSLGPGGE